MCLGIPGKVIEVYQAHATRMGKVDFGGVVKDVCLEFLPEVDIDNYVIVHVGFAITEVDEDSAMETLALIEEIGMLQEELGIISDDLEADDEISG